VSSRLIELEKHSFKGQTNELQESAFHINIQITTVWKIFCKKICFKPYKLQILQTILEENKVKRTTFCKDFIT